MNVVRHVGLAFMKWPSAPGWDCRAHLLTGSSVEHTLASIRMPLLQSQQQGATAFDVHLKWHRTPAPPRWHDAQRAKGGTLAPSTAKQQSNASLLRKVYAHNARDRPKTHKVVVAPDGLSMHCATCELWAP